MGDINKRRGRVIGMEPEGKLQRISAEIPMGEMFTYATDLRSMTQARGSYFSEFLRYEEVPASEVSKILEESKKLKAEAQKILMSYINLKWEYTLKVAFKIFLI